MRRIVPVLLVVAIFIGGAALGRYVVVPLLRGAVPADPAVAALPSPASGAIAQAPFEQCLGQALERRMDPIEARHTCIVIAADL